MNISVRGKTFLWKEGRKSECFSKFENNSKQVYLGDYLHSDMRKGADAQTLSAEILMDCGNLLLSAPYFTQMCLREQIYLKILLTKCHLSLKFTINVK